MGQVRKGTAFLPVAQGKVDTSVVLGLDHHPVHTDVKGEEHGHQHHGQHHHQDDVHDHHDHSHVDVVGRGVQIEAELDRASLESLLPPLVSEHQVLRLKGRLWIPGK